MTSAEADLLVRCRAGDDEAFETLYRQHAGRIYGLVCRMTGSAQEGEDLLQEIFLQAHRKLDRFRGDAAIGTWLYRLAVNHVVDFVKSRRARMDKVTETLAEAPGRSSDPAIGLDLDRAVRQLPPGYREAFVLHDVEGFEHKEVAALLGISEGTSRSQVFKARMKLRALLNGSKA